MYINKKTGELVEAGKLNNGDWEVNFKDRFICLTDKDFHEQYGEAMICPDNECKIMLGAEPCPHRNPHICENKGIITSEPPIGMGCPDCIPYIPEEHKEYDIDNEPVFPICGTCNARKNLDDKRIEQINSTDKIEIFIDGKKTVFVREGKKEKEIMSLLRKIVGQNGWINQEDITNIKNLLSEMGELVDGN